MELPKCPTHGGTYFCCDKCKQKEKPMTIDTKKLEKISPELWKIYTGKADSYFSHHQSTAGKMRVNIALNIARRHWKGGKQ